MKTLQEFCERLADIAAEVCQHYSDYSKALLVGKFMAELRLIYPKVYESKSDKWSQGRLCSVDGCDNRIINKNKSGVCTQCWNEPSVEASKKISSYFMSAMVANDTMRRQQDREADREAKQVITRAMPVMSRMVEMFEPLTMPTVGVKRGRIG